MANPWDSVPHIWRDEQAYLNWLRSQTRRIWSRHPVKTSYVKAREMPVRQAVADKLDIAHKLSPNTKAVCQCERCERWFAKGRMEVDHIDGGVGFSTYDEFLSWQRRMLFVSFDDIRHLCTQCHADITATQKYGCTEAQLPYYRQMTRFREAKVTLQKQMLTTAGITEHGKNKTLREGQYWDYLKGVMKDDKVL